MAATASGHSQRTWGPRRVWHQSDFTTDDSAASSWALGGAEDHDEDAVLPLSVVMDACLVQGIRDQYSCVSKACIG